MLFKRKHESDHTFGHRIGLGLSLFAASISGLYFSGSVEAQANEASTKTTSPDGYVVLNPSLVTGSLQWCYGLNEQGHCELLLGDARSCRNVDSCTPGSANQCPPASDPWFCYGKNENGTCELMMGDKEFCENVTPCNNKRVRLAYFQPPWGDDIWACFGRNDSGQCVTLYGPKEVCDELEPCNRINDFKSSP